MVLEENELDTYISGEVQALHKKNLVKAKKIIVDSIKNHLIPQVSSLKKPKEMFDSLTKLFKGKNINQKMTLRNQLKNEKIHNAETIQSYFTRVSQIKEQLEAKKEEVENVEVSEAGGDESKATHKKNLVKSKRIIGDSIKDHLIPHVSSFKTPKEVFDALIKMLEGNKINQNITLRN